MLSSRAKRGGGFTFEVQHLSEKYFSRGLEPKAFARRVVVDGEAGVEAVGVDGLEVCLTWQEASQATDGILNGAFLPGTVRVAEEGFDAEFVAQDGVLGKLGAVVERVAGRPFDVEFDSGLIVRRRVLKAGHKASGSVELQAARFRFFGSAQSVVGS